MKTIAILQSNYIPWKGYFDLIDSVDEFVIYDDMQYTRRDWRNRNKIKTPQGLMWLTIPVSTKGKYDQRIDETEIEGTAWATKHWNSILSNYKKALHFDGVAELLEPLYANPASMLSEQNVAMLSTINTYLGIDTPLVRSTEYPGEGSKTDRLLSICKAAKADEYVSGPSAKDYFEMEKFDGADIGVTWFEYAGYPEYKQLWGDFEHGVSVIDLLFNIGPDSRQFLKRS